MLKWCQSTKVCRFHAILWRQILVPILSCVFEEWKWWNNKRPTCVVAALKEMPRREHSPRPAATDNVTSRTPASPTAPWDLAQSHRSMVRHAYASCRQNRHLSDVLTHHYIVFWLYIVCTKQKIQFILKSTLVFFSHHQQVSTGHTDHTDVRERLEYIFQSGGSERQDFLRRICSNTL